MASGKYRITKVKRSWDGEKRRKKTIPKVKLTRVSVGDKVIFFDDNNNQRNQADVRAKYYDLLFKPSGEAGFLKFEMNRKGGSANFIFKEMKESENVEIKHINAVLFELCKDNFKDNFVDVGDIAQFTITSIKTDGLEKLGLGVSSSLSEIELEQLLKRQLKKKKINIKFLTKLFFEQNEAKKLHIIENNEKDIYNFLQQFIYWNLVEKKTKGDRINYKSGMNFKDYMKKSVIENRIYENNLKYCDTKTKAAYRKQYVLNCTKKDTDQCFNNYNIPELCKKVQNLELPVIIENQAQLSPLIEVVKEHYKTVVVANVGTSHLSESEKYILSTIHDYIKGRYRKFIDKLWKDSKSQGNSQPIKSQDVKTVFIEPVLTQKITRTLNNKCYTTPLDEGKLNYHIELFKKHQTIEIDEKAITSMDYEYLKAKEAFLSKVTTAVSMSGYTLSSNLDISTDFLGGNSKFTNWQPPFAKDNEFKAKIVDRFLTPQCTFSSVSDIQDFINTIVDLRLHAAHYKLNMPDLIQKGLNLHTKSYVSSIIAEMGNIYIESLMSNNVINFYDESNIVSFIEQNSFRMSENSLYYPNFEKVYKEFEKISESKGLQYSKQLQDVSNYKYVLDNDIYRKEDKTEIEKIAASQKRQALKFILQELYYDVFMQNVVSIQRYKELYQRDGEDEFNDIITENYSEHADVKKMKQMIQSEAALHSQNVQKLNQKWIRFITANFITFLESGNYQWLFEDMKYDESKTFEKESVIIENICKKYREIIMVEKLTGLEGSFIATATLVDRKEVAHLSHDIKKFIQFCKDLKMKCQSYKIDEQLLKEYTGEFETHMVKVVQILEIIVKVKDRDENIRIQHPNQTFEDRLKVITDISISDANIQIDGTVQQHNLFKDGENYNNFKGINRVEKYGTIRLMQPYFEKNSKYKFSQDDLENINKNYNQSETLNEKYNNFLATFNSSVKGVSKSEKYEDARNIMEQDAHALHNMYCDAKTAHEEYLGYMYAQSKYKGEQLNRAHHFVMDVYGHFIAWATRWERDMKYFVMANNPNKNLKDRIYNLGNYNFEAALSQLHKGDNKEQILQNMENLKLLNEISKDINGNYETKETKFRNDISHFNYFSGYNNFNKSLLDICNEFYQLFSYNTKYQRDVQTVMNNIFEKYGMVAINKDGSKAPVLKYQNGSLMFANKIDSSIVITAKSHMYFPGFKLVHENQIKMLRDLFEYKK